MAEAEAERSKRNQSIINAVSTSLVSKVSSLVLQFISLPVAAKVLGKAEFGIYSTISMTVTTIILLQLGLGPIMGKTMAEAAAEKQPDRERKLYFNGLLLVIGFCSIGLITFFTITSLVSIPTLFGQSYAGWKGEMTSALKIGVILLFLMSTVSVHDSMREGYMEASISNTWTTIGNIIAAITIFVGINHYPSVSFLLLAMFVPQVLVRMINTYLLWQQKPHLNFFTKPTKLDRSTTKTLLTEGMSFTLVYTIVFLVEFNLCTIIVGRIYGPEEVALFQVLMTLSMAFIRLIDMVATPLWAAIIDARKLGEQSWVVLAIKRYYLFYAGLVAISTLVLCSLGPWLVTKWYGEEFAISRTTFLSFCLFLAALGWRDIHLCLSLGLDKLRVMVIPILLALVVGLGIGIFGLMHYRLTGLYAGLAIGVLTCAAVPVSRLIWRSVRDF